jgi:putative transposase
MPPARREGSAFSRTALSYFSFCGYAAVLSPGRTVVILCGMPGIFMVSSDTPAYYLTSVPRDRLPVFKTDPIKAITCNALDEARESGKFLILAYVIMPDHLHFVAAGDPKPSEILRFVNGVSARRIITHLRESGHESSLRKLERESGERKHKYSLWDHNPDVRILTNEDSLMQRVNYTHQNPVRLDLVDRAVDYKWSSARQWNGIPIEDEPLEVDIKSIRWRKS